MLFQWRWPAEYDRRVRLTEKTCYFSMMAISASIALLWGGGTFIASNFISALGDYCNNFHSRIKVGYGSSDPFGLRY